MDENFIPDDVLLLAEEASNTLIPEKSRDRYDKELHAFNEWREKQSTSKVLNETVVLAYIAGLAKTFKPSSLWTKFSMLRKSLQICENVDIYKFGKVVAFVKKQNIGYKPKKSKTLNDEQCRKFIMEAPDDQFLLSKVVLIFGLYGACRRDELLKLTVDDVEDHKKYMLVSLQQTKTYTPRSFVIPDTASSSINPYAIYCTYAGLRPRNIGTRRLFLGYRNGKCIAQPAGMHIIGGVPKKVAEFLALEHPEDYTGHCLRRSGASMVAESCGNLLPVKKIGGWKSSATAEGYLEQSTKGKLEVAKMVLTTDSHVDSSDLRSMSTSDSDGKDHAPVNSLQLQLQKGNVAGLTITGNSNCTITLQLPPNNN